MSVTVRPVGDLLREWRQRRRLSQLDLALEAEISTRHLSFLETGRSRPSRDMVLRLAERLDVPLRDRNVLLHAAGFATVFPERPLDDPALRIARQAVDQVLPATSRIPALAVDRHWTLVAAERRRRSGCWPASSRALLQPPVNVLRLACIREGLAPRTDQSRANGARTCWRGCAIRSMSPPIRCWSGCCANCVTIPRLPTAHRAGRRGLSWCRSALMTALPAHWHSSAP